MEYWNVGIPGLLELNLFHMDGTNQKIKSDYHPLLIANIAFSHHSIIPSSHHSIIPFING